MVLIMFQRKLSSEINQKNNELCVFQLATLTIRSLRFCYAHTYTVNSSPFFSFFFFIIILFVIVSARASFHFVSYVFERFVEDEAENKCQVVVVFYVQRCFGDYFTIIRFLFLSQRKMCIPDAQKKSFFGLFKIIIFLFLDCVSRSRSLFFTRILFNIHMHKFPIDRVYTYVALDLCDKGTAMICGLFF